ncbi:MAG TPA: hypothetical protein VK629_12225 [Steroidobacteraceae bacterium]|nr:hypothetical protein [Steroidobacteraceae bacterium]
MQEYIGRPLIQAVFFALLTMVIMPIVRPKITDSVYGIAGAIYAVFMLVNSIAICFAPKVWPYFSYSMLFSIIYIVVMFVVLNTYISVTKTEGSAESSMVFVVIMYHPFGLLLMIFLKWAYMKIF